MVERTEPYVIVGGGVAGAAAVEGLREVDADGPVVLFSGEPELPYNRPPLSKQLWTGAETVEKIAVHDRAFYDTHRVELRLNSRITRIDPASRTVWDTRGEATRYRTLLLATGGTPRRLKIAGGDLEGISYFRTLADYRRLRAEAGPGRSALVIGGGFIGSEIAAALRTVGVSVTMIFPSPRLVSRIFPADLGDHLTAAYREKGIEVITGDEPTSIERRSGGYRTRTRTGHEIRSDLVVVGIGITPDVALAQEAGLASGDGVTVNEYLQSSDPGVYAAGDVTRFPEAVLGERRVEHWDAAVSQGKAAGRNMAGAREPFTQLPFFFSDLFEFGYEAVGEIDSRLRTVADWQEPFKTGVIYYLADRKLRGVMMCNVWNKVDEARALIRRGGEFSDESLRGAIR